MITRACGTFTGLLLHQEAGEPVCGTCANAERARLVAAESQPAPSQTPPITAMWDDDVSIARRRRLLDSNHYLENPRLSDRSSA